MDTKNIAVTRTKSPPSRNLHTNEDRMGRKTVDIHTWVSYLLSGNKHNAEKYQLSNEIIEQ